MAPTDVLDRLRAERDQCRNAALALVEADDYDPESDALRNLEERGASLDAQIERLVGIAESQAAADALDGRIARAARTSQQTRSAPGAELTTRESWGEAFTRSEQFTEYRGRGQSAMYEVPNGVQHRALPTGVGDLVSAGFSAAAYQVDVSAPPAPTPLLDNITKIQVSGNAIEYVSWAKTAGGAAKVAEKAPKPSAEWAPTVTSTVLDNIAVYTQLTRQLIEDFASVRDMINNELRRDVDRAVEADAAAVLAAATLPSVGTVGGDLLASIRAGMGMVQAAGYMATAVLLNPADWANLDVAIFTGTQSGPTVGQSFWGLRAISSPAQPAGTATVGDFMSAVQHYYRSAVSLYITDSHAETFLANVFTLLAEQRSKTAVVRPQALVECLGK